MTAAVKQFRDKIKKTAGKSLLKKATAAPS